MSVHYHDGLATAGQREAEDVEDVQVSIQGPFSYYRTGRMNTGEKRTWTISTSQQKVTPSVVKSEVF